MAIYNLPQQDYTAFKAADAKLADKKGSNRTIFYVGVGDLTTVSAIYASYDNKVSEIRVLFPNSPLATSIVLTDYPDAILIASVVGVS